MALPNTFTDSDPTVTVHADHHNDLADAINAYGGGATGQVPTKNSGTDHDITWTTPSGGSGGSTSFVSSQKWGTD